MSWATARPRPSSRRRTNRSHPRPRDCRASPGTSTQPAPPANAPALGARRLRVSGSAALPVREFERIERTTGQRIVERYGLTETIMNSAVRADGERRPGYVGPPLPGVDVRLVDDDGATIGRSDDETIGEVAVRRPNV